MFKLGIVRSFGACALVLLAVRALAQAPLAGLGLPQAPPQQPLLPTPQPAIPQQSGSDDGIGLLLQLTPPPPDRLFQFKSEEQVRQQIREDFKTIRKVEFPPFDEVVPALFLPPRIWPDLLATAAPGYVCYKRPWFEQVNSERYGWSLGVFQPILSTGIFYTDLALLPWHWLTDPCRWYECSSGRCLPGDTVPLLWNPVFSGK